ncbi:hypothetical protein M9Y10_018650 [Tritrichomonas musculus]|uniref:MatE family protein n=1 Tax=Tritrichomonas musculus TaxID=1915356 RepID=A0ABR2HMA7_9EUKA
MNSSITPQPDPDKADNPSKDNKTPTNHTFSSDNIANIRDDDDSPSSFEVKMENKDSIGDEINEKNQQEIYRLAGRKPLITICHLMVGPIISQVTGALYGIINSIWISKKLGEKGLSAIATEITLEGIGRAFGYFLMIAGSTKISQLFGRKKFDEATQVACDLLRCTIICGIIVPVCILPAHNAMCRWYKASEETTRLGFEYITPLCGCSVLTCINLCCQGFLQAEGRTMLIGIIDLISLIVACFGICPLLLFGLNCGICSASVSTVCADAIPGILLLILYFRGKFGIKPKAKQLLKPFSKNTWPALVVGLSQLVSNLSGCIPGIPIRNLIGRSCATEREYDLAMSGFNVQNRVYSVATCIYIAVTTGFIPPASYAHASSNDRRFLRLSLHAAWINFAWSCLVTILALSMPKPISQIFGHGNEFLDYAVPMLMNSNYTGFFRWVQFNSQAMLQALQRGWQAMIVSLMSNFAGFLIFAYIFYYTDKHNVRRLMYLYSCTNAFGAIVGICLLIYPLLRLYRKSKIQRAQNQQENQNINNKDKEIKLEEIKKSSSNLKKSLKEIRKSSTKFESNYLDLDSTVNSALPRSRDEHDKSNDETDGETNNLPEI